MPRCEEEEDLLNGTGGDLVSGYLGFGWRIHGSHILNPTAPAPSASPGGWWPTTNPWFSGAALFSWVDAVEGGQPIDLYGTPRHSWIERTFNFPTRIGYRAGIRAQCNWTLDTGPGNLFFEVQGATTSRFSAFNTGAAFWDFTAPPTPKMTDIFINSIIPPSGDLIVRMGGENYSPSCNVFAAFSALKIVTCKSARSYGYLKPRV